MNMEFFLCEVKINLKNSSYYYTSIIVWHGLMCFINTSFEHYILFSNFSYSIRKEI